ncbi:MAG: hypothetical protein ACO3VQ_05130 [Ilumatobacteraceae bacterium]
MSNLPERQQQPTVAVQADKSMMTFEELLRAADVLARSRIIPQAYRQRADDIVAAGLAGNAYRWDVMTSMRNYHVIEGTASLRPEAMLGLVRRAGHSVTLDFGETADGVRYANAHGKRWDSGDEHLATFSTDDAKQAGLLGKKNWSQYLDSMLTWRAISALCRVLFPDVVLGAGYSPEEIGGDVEVDASGTPVEADPFADPVIPIPEAKRRLLAACEGDKDKARTLWESQENLPAPAGIVESELQKLIDAVWEADIQDAEIVSEDAHLEAQYEEATDIEPSLLD